ncbi:MAG: VOC family protein [Planctomycetota bacterium]
MKLGYVILYVPSIPDAVDFYERAFGLTCRLQSVEGNMGYAEMETGSTVLSFATEELARSHGFDFRATRPDVDSPSFEVAFVTDDVQAAFDKAIAAGATSASEPTQKEWGQTVSYVRDIHGYLVEICSPMTPLQ